MTRRSNRYAFGLFLAISLGSSSGAFADEAWRGFGRLNAIDARLIPALSGLGYGKVEMRLSQCAAADRNTLCGYGLSDGIRFVASGADETSTPSALFIAGTEETDLGSLAAVTQAVMAVLSPDTSEEERREQAKTLFLKLKTDGSSDGRENAKMMETGTARYAIYFKGDTIEMLVLPR